jgi:hypothetical protein
MVNCHIQFSDPPNVFVFTKSTIHCDGNIITQNYAWQNERERLLLRVTSHEFHMTCCSMWCTNFATMRDDVLPCTMNTRNLFTTKRIYTYICMYMHLYKCMRCLVTAVLTLLRTLVNWSFSIGKLKMFKRKVSDAFIRIRPFYLVISNSTSGLKSQSSWQNQQTLGKKRYRSH